jgi:hypothetical protein
MKIPFITRPIIQKFIYRLVPKNRWGDKLVALFWFVRHHNRLSTNKTLFNDVMFNIKTSGELLDPTRQFVSDKEMVKLFISTVVGPQHNVPTYKVLTTPEEIDAYDFPDTCCIKPTHSCGEVILRKDGEAIDRQDIKDWLSLNYYDTSREANYRYLEPKIIVEELLFNSKEAYDYKIHCNGGKATMITVHVDKRGNEMRARYDVDWTLQDYCIDAIPFVGTIERPKNLDQMLLAAEQIAKHFSFIRVDIYTDDNDFYIGEITNCPGSANASIQPEIALTKLSKLVFGS